MNDGRQLTSSRQVRRLVAATALAAVGVAHAQHAPLFPLPIHATDDGPLDIVAGDVTGDGLLDLVTANRYDGTLTLLASGGAGDFDDAVTLPAGEQPAGLVAADVSGDGLADLVFGDTWNQVLSLYVADGAGGFAGPTTVPVAHFADTVLAGDMNGDGDLDLVSAAFATATVIVQLADGVGGFVPSAKGFVGAGPHDATLADVDADGDLDVITADQNGQSLSILSGNPFGGFSEYQALELGASMTCVAAGDLDADGDIDLAAGASVVTPYVFVWWGEGGGDFGLAHPYGLSSATALEIVDFDADETLDIVAAAGNTVRWLPGDGEGGFDPAVTVPVTQGGGELEVRDLDDDGDLDVALASDTHDHVTVLLAEAPATFPINVEVKLGGTSLAQVNSIAAGDVTGDGASDVVVIAGYPYTVKLLVGDGQGGLGAPQLVPSTTWPGNLLLSDMDGDGLADLVYLSAGSDDDFATVQLGDGTGGFAGPVSTAVTGSNDVATGDVNGDGHADAVVLQDGSFQLGQIHVLAGDGAGGLGAPASVPVANGADLKDVLLADVTGDARQDALVLGDHSIFILAGDGLGGFVLSGQLSVSQGGAQAWTLAAGDFDADGDVDLATPDNERVDILINAGAGSFLPKVSLPAQLGAKQIAQRDMDGDGLQDLVTANDTSGTVTVFAGDGAGGFVARHYLTGNEPSRLVVTDMDGDGAPDLVLGNDGPPSLTLVPNLTGSPAWTDLGFALAGAVGAPTLSGTGELVAGAPGTIALGNAAPLAPAVLFVSLLSQPQPFKGGMLVPVPVMLVLPLPTGAGGSVTLAFAWPSGIPTGTELYLQAAIQDAAAPAGVALSNALRGVGD